MTNRDKINQMSDEELVEYLFLFRVFPCRSCNYKYGSKDCTLKCDKAILNWLKSEVNEE